MTHGLYEVIGKREYRGHPPGTFFEARLDPAAEQRAIDRGDIKLIRLVTPALEPGSFHLPHDWPPPAANGSQAEAPDGASLMN